MNAPTQWIEQLTHAVSACIVMDDDVPLGCHVHRGQDSWEITLFVLRVEILGGKTDGRRITLPFHVDLTSLPWLFDEVESFAWQPCKLGEGDDLGPHVAIVGRYQSEPVWLRIQAEAPADMPPGKLLCARTLQLHTL
jgi:hypothetical protein